MEHDDHPDCTINSVSGVTQLLGFSYALSSIDIVVVTREAHTHTTNTRAREAKETANTHKPDRWIAERIVKISADEHILVAIATKIVDSPNVARLQGDFFGTSLLVAYHSFDFSDAILVCCEDAKTAHD